LFVILDEHDFDDCSKDADACAQILPNVWYELSAHYKDAPSSVMFELLNEPHDKIDAQIWNAWLPDLVAIVRETNPTRNIIVGPTHWNSLADLPQLKLPADKHIIVTFHYYDPMTFTHQGATWVGPEIEKERGEVHWKGTSADLAKINGDFDQVAAWAKANDRPILLGEFGTFAKYSAIDERAASAASCWTPCTIARYEPNTMMPKMKARNSGSISANSTAEAPLRQRKNLVMAHLETQSRAPRCEALIKENYENASANQ